MENSKYLSFDLLESKKTQGDSSSIAHAFSDKNPFFKKAQEKSKKLKHPSDFREQILELLLKRFSLNCSSHAMDLLLKNRSKFDSFDFVQVLYKSAWCAKASHRSYLLEEDVCTALEYAHIDFWQYELMCNAMLKEALETKGLKQCLEEFETFIVGKYLVDCGGNFAKLARQLKIPKTTFISRLKKLRRNVNALESFFKSVFS